VPGVFASEDRIVLPHERLDEGVPDARANRDPTVLADRFGNGARADEVVHNLGTGCLCPECLGDEGSDHITADQTCLLVEDEHAVSVTVESDAHVRSVLADRALQISDVFRFDRVRYVVREAAVELEVERDDAYR